MFILFPCQNVTLLTTPIKEKPCSKNAQLWKKAYMDMLIVFIELLFGLRQLSPKIFRVFDLA